MGLKQQALWIKSRIVYIFISHSLYIHQMELFIIHTNGEYNSILMDQELGMVIHLLVWTYILMMFGFPMRRMTISHKPTTKKMTLVQIYNILFASGLYTIQLTLILSTSFPLFIIPTLLYIYIFIYIYILYTCDFILIWFFTTERDTNPSGKFHSFSNFGWLWLEW